MRTVVCLRGLCFSLLGCLVGLTYVTLSLSQGGDEGTAFVAPYGVDDDECGWNATYPCKTLQGTLDVLHTRDLSLATAVHILLAPVVFSTDRRNCYLVLRDPFKVPLWIVGSHQSGEDGEEETHTSLSDCSYPHSLGSVGWHFVGGEVHLSNITFERWERTVLWHRYVSSIFLDGCSFVNNTSGGVSGGVIFSDSDFPLVATNSRFGGNNGVGGVLFAMAEAGSFTFQNCQFRWNYGTQGGVVWMQNSEVSFENCEFEGNVATKDGSVLYLSGGDSIQESIVQPPSRAFFRRSHFRENPITPNREACGVIALNAVASQVMVSDCYICETGSVVHINALRAYAVVAHCTLETLASANPLNVVTFGTLFLSDILLKNIGLDYTIVRQQAGILIIHNVAIFPSYATLHAEHATGRTALTSDMVAPSPESAYVLAGETWQAFSEIGLPKSLMCPSGMAAPLSTKMCVSCAQFSYKLTSSMKEELSQCLPCPSGTQCMMNRVAPEKGYWLWQNPDNPDEITSFVCPKERCRGANLTQGTPITYVSLSRKMITQPFLGCADTYTGVLCGECAEGLSMWGDKCISCTHTRWDNIVLVLCIMWTFVIAQHRACQAPSGPLKILLYFLQTSYLILPRRVVWTWSLSLASYSSAGTGMCLFPRGEYGRFGVEILTPFVLLALLVLTFAVSRGIWCALYPQRSWPVLLSCDGLCRTIIALCLFAFQTLAVTSIAFFNCITVGDMTVIASAPSVSCDTATYRDWSILYASCLALAVCGPLGVAVFLWRMRTKLVDSAVCRRYGTLYDSYRLEGWTYLWESCVLARRLLIVSAVVLAEHWDTGDSYAVRSLVLSLLCFAVFLLHFSILPFRKWRDNAIESLSLGCLTCIAFASGSPLLVDSETAATVVLSILLVIPTTIIVVVLFMRLMYWTKDKSTRELQQLSSATQSLLS